MKRVVIMGAAGRDFHVFNCCYRADDQARVVAFTATQIPHIENRRYPPLLAGPHYPDGVPIVPEESLTSLLENGEADQVVFAYSDVTVAHVEECRKLVESHDVSFSTFDIDATMLASDKTVIAVTATRTGCGKSQTSRRVTEILREAGLRTVAVRHPMPYGDLSRQVVQRFATLEDLETQHCTIEECEEYEPHIRNGVIVYAGVDYEAILREAEQEADVIVWDGGNNDTPFYRPDLWIVVTDPHRAGHEEKYFPGGENFRRADIVIINKVDSADEADIAAVEASAARLNPGALVVRASSPVSVPNPAAIRGKRVLVIEDGPTTTHGGMAWGAGTLAARQHGAAERVDPRPWARGEIAETFESYPDTGPLLPAMGYGEAQVRDLEATINSVDCDLVLVATPVDLSRLIDIRHPFLRVTYRLEEEGDALENAIRASIE